MPEPPKEIVVSSAKRRVKSFEAVYKSLIKHMNKRGPRTDPCGTELVTSSHSELLSQLQSSLDFVKSQGRTHFT